MYHCGNRNDLLAPLMLYRLLVVVVVVVVIRSTSVERYRARSLTLTLTLFIRGTTSEEHESGPGRHSLRSRRTRPPEGCDSIGLRVQSKIHTGINSNWGFSPKHALRLNAQALPAG